MTYTIDAPEAPRRGISSIRAEGQPRPVVHGRKAVADHELKNQRLNSTDKWELYHTDEDPRNEGPGRRIPKNSGQLKELWWLEAENTAFSHARKPDETRPVFNSMDS
jgi:hypothetical protein